MTKKLRTMHMSILGSFWVSENRSTQQGVKNVKFTVNSSVPDVPHKVIQPRPSSFHYHSARTLIRKCISVSSYIVLWIDLVVGSRPGKEKNSRGFLASQPFNSHGSQCNKSQLHLDKIYFNFNIPLELTNSVELYGKYIITSTSTRFSCWQVLEVVINL